MTSPEPDEEAAPPAKDAARPDAEPEPTSAEAPEPAPQAAEAEPSPPAEEPEPAPPTNPAYAPAAPAPPPDYRRHKVVGFAVSGAVLLVVIGYLVWTNVAWSPEAVVAKYFEAIIAKDVEEAFSHVDGEIPYGDEAVFLHPDAIADDWELVDTVANVDGDFGTTVTVTLEHDGRPETSDIEVTRTEGDWKVADPFITVSIASGALTYFQVNDRIVELDRLYEQDVTGLAHVEYQLLPGLNRFFGDMKANSVEPDPAELMFPREEGQSSSDNPVAPPDFETTDAAREALQEAVNELIDDCADSTVRLPVACPFGIEGSYRADGDTRYEDFHDITWTVNEYPRVDATSTYEEDQYALGVDIDTKDSGEIELSANAFTQEMDPAKLEVKCRFDTRNMRVGFTPEGEPRVYALPMAGTAIAQGPWQVDSCNEPGDEE